MFTFTHRNPEMQLDKPRTALVLADMQNEFLEEKPEGTYYALIADALKKRLISDGYPPRWWEYVAAIVNYPIYKMHQSWISGTANRRWPQVITESDFIAGRM